MRSQEEIRERLERWQTRRDELKACGQPTPYEDAIIKILTELQNYSEENIIRELRLLARLITSENLMDKTSKTNLSAEEWQRIRETKIRGRVLIWLLGKEIPYMYPSDPYATCG